MEIKFEKVSFAYNFNSALEHEVLKNISLQIKEGKITTILGKSGSGKTTLIELMNGLLTPTKGKIKVGDFVLEGKKQDLRHLHRQVGFLFQFPEEQFFRETVEQEIGVAVDSFQYRTNEKTKRIEEALQLVGLDKSYLKRDSLTLSNGEMRKVALASILIYNPKVLILDEPTIGLDEASKKSMLQLFRMLKRRFHKTIIIVSHDIEFIHKLTDYIYVLNNGKIVLKGDKYEVFKEEEKLSKYGVSVPQVIRFSNKVFEKKQIKIGYRDEINDLIKDIYRYVR